MEIFALIVNITLVILLIVNLIARKKKEPTNNTGLSEGELQQLRQVLNMMSFTGFENEDKH